MNKEQERKVCQESGRWVDSVCERPLPCPIHSLESQVKEQENIDTVEEHDDAGLEGWIAKWFPEDINIVTLDGDNRSAKERLRDIFSSIRVQHEKELVEARKKELEWVLNESVKEQVDCSDIIEERLEALAKK